MNKTAWIVLIIIVIVAVGAYFVFAKHAAAPAPMEATTTAMDMDMGSTTVTTGNTGATAPAAQTVTYTDSGFAPASVTVNLGDTVRFVNNSSGLLWVASNPHPTHTGYDGTSLSQHCTNGTNNNGSFDECTAIPAGSAYNFTFAKTGTFGYHNHMSPSNLGTVVVQ